MFFAKEREVFEVYSDNGEKMSKIRTICSNKFRLLFSIKKRAVEYFRSLHWLKQKEACIAETKLLCFIGASIFWSISTFAQETLNHQQKANGQIYGEPSTLFMVSEEERVAQIEISQSIQSPRHIKIDLGEMAQFDSRDVVYKLTNTANEAVRVTEIKGSCPCVSDLPTSFTIEGGQSRSIHLDVYSKRNRGEISQSLFFKVKEVSAEGSKWESFLLELKAYVKSAPSVYPLKLNFKDTESLSEQEIIIKGWAESFSIVSVESSIPEVAVTDVIEVRNSVGRPTYFKVNVMLTSKNSKNSGKDRPIGELSVKTTDSTYPYIAIPIEF